MPTTARRCRRGSVRAAAALLLATVPALAAAQSVAGRVREDGTRRLLAGVAVALLDSAGFAVAKTTTDGAGDFFLDAPAPGRYALAFAWAGATLTSAPRALARGEDVQVEYFLAPTTAPPPRVADDVARLASPAFGGRRAGTAGADSAAALIALRYLALGLRGAFPADCSGGAAPPCAREYLQFFFADGARAHNVAALVPGSDSTLRGEYVVVGAHLDHLGRSAPGALDAEFGPALHPGADDNASGTAAVLELARRLAVRPARRSVLLVNFDAEEMGLVGSSVFVERPPVPLDSVVLMVNLDMVGRLGRGPLLVDAGGPKHRWVRALADSAAAAEGVRVGIAAETAGRSDHASFRRSGVPAVQLFTGFHSDYHRASDVAARVDESGLLRVIDVAEGIVRRAAGDAEAARYPESRTQ